MPEQRRARGLLDISVVIDIELLSSLQLPVEVASSALTMAELAAGPHATADPDERGRRQDRLQRAEAVFDPLPFDAEAARAYGRIYSAVAAAGRKARGARAVDLLIAALARRPFRSAPGSPMASRLSTTLSRSSPSRHRPEQRVGGQPSRHPFRTSRHDAPRIAMRTSRTFDSGAVLFGAAQTAPTQRLR